MRLLNRLFWIKFEKLEMLNMKKQGNKKFIKPNSKKKIEIKGHYIVYMTNM